MQILIPARPETLNRVPRYPGDFGVTMHYNTKMHPNNRLLAYSDIQASYDRSCRARLFTTIPGSFPCLAAREQA